MHKLKFIYMLCLLSSSAFAMGGKGMNGPAVDPVSFPEGIALTDTATSTSRSSSATPDFSMNPLQQLASSSQDSTVLPSLPSGTQKKSVVPTLPIATNSIILPSGAVVTLPYVETAGNSSDIVSADRSLASVSSSTATASSTSTMTNTSLRPLPKQVSLDPNQEISASVLGKQLVISTSGRFAGAIDSLIWNNQQFINSTDHGRELQSAVSYDSLGECLNPTEAGSLADSNHNSSTSKLVSMSADGNSLSSTIQMAYWTPVGYAYPQGCNSGKSFFSAQNTTNLSNDTISKDVTIGYDNIENVIEYTVTLSVSAPHSNMTFESLTGYMPANFSSFYSFDPAKSALTPLSPGPGEQNEPVILATPSGSYAMGIYSPDIPQADYANVGYGRFAFPGNTMKWNAVFRKNETPAGKYTVHDFVIVGSLAQVQSGMHALYLSLQNGGVPTDTASETSTNVNPSNSAPASGVVPSGGIDVSGQAGDFDRNRLNKD